MRGSKCAANSRRQIVESAHGMAFCDTLQRVLEIGEWLDALKLGVVKARSDDGLSISAAIEDVREMVFTTEHGWPEETLTVDCIRPYMAVLKEMADGHRAGGSRGGTPRSRSAGHSHYRTNRTCVTQKLKRTKPHGLGCGLARRAEREV